MVTGIFTSASDAYINGATALWRWLGKCLWLLKPVAICWVAPASVILFLVGAFLRLGMVFDFIAYLVETLRNAILRSVAHTAGAMRTSRVAYFFAPFIVIPITPAVLVAGFIPKLGLADAITDFQEDYEPDGRYFQRAAAHYGLLLAAARSGLSGHGLIFFPLAALSATIMIPWSLAAAALFLALKLLDWISALLDWMRDSIISGVQSLGRGAGGGLVAAVFCPVLLIAMLPLLLAVLVVPKLTTSSHHA